MALELKEHLQDIAGWSENAQRLSMWYFDDGYIIATRQKLQKGLEEPNLRHGAYFYHRHSPLWVTIFWGVLQRISWEPTQQKDPQWAF